ILVSSLMQLTYAISDGAGIVEIIFNQIIIALCMFFVWKFKAPLMGILMGSGFNYTYVLNNPMLKGNGGSSPHEKPNNPTKKRIKTDNEDDDDIEEDDKDKTTGNTIKENVQETKNSYLDEDEENNLSDSVDVNDLNEDNENNGEIGSTVDELRKDMQVTEEEKINTEEVATGNDVKDTTDIPDYDDTSSVKDTTDFYNHVEMDSDVRSRFDEIAGGIDYESDKSEVKLSQDVSDRNWEGSQQLMKESSKEIVTDAEIQALVVSQQNVENGIEDLREELKSK
ncbi:TPA: hypothetical protein IP990_002784, partial [Listeria monocytogenes]|nr:hypothetical protein [Listeria monocytogenes]